jgi:hypothetical protein
MAYAGVADQDVTPKVYSMTPEKQAGFGQQPVDI